MYKIIIIANLTRIKTFSLIYTNPLNHTVINKHEYFERISLSLYLAVNFYISVLLQHSSPPIYPSLSDISAWVYERDRRWEKDKLMSEVYHCSGAFLSPTRYKIQTRLHTHSRTSSSVPLYHRIVVRLQKTGPKAAAAAHQDFPSSNAPTWRTVEHPPCNSIWSKNPLPTTTTTTSEFRLWRLVCNTHSTACVSS